MENRMMRLADRGVLKVGGPEAGAFLQGLVTSDVLALKPGEARYAALLSPQGKILFDFLVFCGADGFYYLDVLLAQAADLVKRLGFYRLRARVEIADVSAELGVAAFARDPALATGYRDPRHEGLGWRAILPLAGLAGEDSAWEARRIALGVPKGGTDFVYGDTFPHEANLDLLHGVDFKKGCYIGQEVVSRVEHRGLARKRIVRLRFAGAAPAMGAAVVAGDLALGVMGSSAGGMGLAMLRVDRVAQAKEVGVMAGGVGVEVQP